MYFKDIQGQEKAIGFLQDDLRQDRLAASYLFLGPEGVGKFLTALALAQAVNCLEDSFEPCNRCASCIRIEKNQHPDFHLFGNNIDEAENKERAALKIEDIRILQKEINLRPFEARKKVFILDNAHDLTAEAANALLKILEEPPKNSLIILLSSKPGLLFKTVISRCRMVKFQTLARKNLESLLKKNYQLDNFSAHFLAYFSEGRLGVALKLNEGHIPTEKNRLIGAFMEKPSLNNTQYLAGKSRQEIRQAFNLLAAWLRDIYLLKIGLPHDELINVDRKLELLRIMSQYSFAELDEALNHISNSLLYLDKSVNLKLVLSSLRTYLKG